MIQKKYREIALHIFDTREEMGNKAADDAAETILKVLQEKELVNCIFAAAPSQNEFLEALSQKSLPWNRINAFHMDEYVGFAIGSPQSFSGFLNRSVFNKVPFRTVNLINGLNEPQQECERYSALLEENPPDIVFMGIGENGHLAFNDPPVADFNDSKKVKTVFLDLACRTQQVNDKCFPTLEDVPVQAITLTIPALVSAPHLFCIVPGERKADATTAALTGEVNEKCPASILQLRKGCRMYIDKACAWKL